MKVCLANYLNISIALTDDTNALDLTDINFYLRTFSVIVCTV